MKNKFPAMDVHVPVEEFNSALWKRFQDGKIRNVYPIAKYKDIIEKIKSMNENPPCNIPGEYYLLRKFVVVNIAGKERLSCKPENNAVPESNSDNNSVMKFYVALEEIYNYIEEAHKWVKHGCRDRIVRKIQNQGIVNITRDTVELFLSFCKLCRPRKREFSRKGGTKSVQPANTQCERICDSPISNTSNGSDIHREHDENLPVIISSSSTNAISVNLNQNNPCNTVCTFTRGFIDLIDFSSCPDGDYRFVFLYIDLQTCFCVMYPTRSKCKYEIVTHLLSIFTLIGPPQVLHSNFENEFLALIIQELKLSWPDIVIVSGSKNYLELEEVAQNCINELNSMLKVWMTENQSNHWSFGLKIVQLRKNTKLPSNGTKCPYECFFGHSMNSSNIPSNINLAKLKDVQREDDLLILINEQSQPEPQPYEHIQVSLDPTVCKLVHLQQNVQMLDENGEVNGSKIKMEPLSDSEIPLENGFELSNSSNENSSPQMGNLEIIIKQEVDEETI